MPASGNGSNSAKTLASSPYVNQQSGNQPLSIQNFGVRDFQAIRADSNGRPRKFNKLEKLLAQPDIFETLVKINNGTIKTFDELDMNAMVKKQE